MDKALNKRLSVSSPAFMAEGYLPQLYTCDGRGISPPITIHNIPATCVSLALIMEDPDATANVFYHWLVWNIPARLSDIREDGISGVPGSNSTGTLGYLPPCPLAGTHRYYFHVYALKGMTDLPEGADIRALMHAIQPQIIQRNFLMVKYQRRS